MGPGPIDLVTGGAGFIGSHLVYRLVGGGRSVRVIDDLSTGDASRLDRVKDRIDVIVSDLTTSDLRAALNGVQRIFHLAAVPSVPRSVQDPLSSHHASATATLRLLIAARDAPVRRIVLSSSSSVYGESAALPKHEGMALWPRSPYAVAKTAAEGYGRVFADLYGSPTVILRYFNVFGPGQDPTSSYAAVIPLFIRRALEGLSIPVYGDGTQTRDFTYVENVVDANLAAAEATVGFGRSFNVAAGEPRTILDLVASLGRIVGRTLTVDHLPPRRGDVLHSHGDVSAARAELGWSPRVSFDEGLRRTVDWYRMHVTPASAAV